MGDLSKAHIGLNDLSIPSFTTAVEEGLVDVLGLELISGRGFSDSPGDSSAVIINATAARSLGFEPEEMTGSRIALHRDDLFYTVIGVVEDFHFESYQHRIAPLVMTKMTEETFDRHLYLSYAGNDFSALLNSLEEHWKAQNIAAPLVWHWPRDKFLSNNKTDQAFQDIIQYFSVVCLIILSIGLIAFINSNMERYLHEVIVRKIFGASVTDIFMSLQKKFVYALAGAIVTGGFLSWYFSAAWMDNFVYKADIKMGLYAVPLLVTLLIVAGITAYKTVLVLTMVPGRLRNLN